jgi:hypothetical protein
MTPLEIEERLGLLGRPDDPESNPYGLLAVRARYGQGERMILGFPQTDEYISGSFILDVPNVLQPVALSLEDILAMMVFPQQQADERLSLGFLEGVVGIERKKLLEAFLHTSVINPLAELCLLFPGMTDEKMISIRNYCRGEAVRSGQWTVIMSPPALHDDGPVQCRVVVPYDDTIEFGGYSSFGALWMATVPGPTRSHVQTMLQAVQTISNWKDILWQNIANTIDKTLSVIVYDRGDSPIGFVRIAEHVFVPAF